MRRVFPFLLPALGLGVFAGQSMVLQLGLLSPAHRWSLLVGGMPLVLIAAWKLGGLMSEPLMVWVAQRTGSGLETQLQTVLWVAAAMVAAGMTVAALMASPILGMLVFNGFSTGALWPLEAALAGSAIPLGALWKGRMREANGVAGFCCATVAAGALLGPDVAGGSSWFVTTGLLVASTLVCGWQLAPRVRGETTFEDMLGLLVVGCMAGGLGLMFMGLVSHVGAGLLGVCSIVIGLIWKRLEESARQEAATQPLQVQEREMPALGFRGFRVNPAERRTARGVERIWLLGSMSNRGLLQAGPLLQAECANRCDAVPGDHHECGLYALAYLSAVPGWGPHLDVCRCCVITAVRGYGEVVEHQEGFRASEMEILAVLNRGEKDEQSEAIARQLGVPFLDRLAMKAYCTEQAARLPHEVTSDLQRAS